MITPPDIFENYWELEAYFRQYGGAIRHSINGNFETVSIRTIDEERQSVSDFHYETNKEGKMEIKKGIIPVKYVTIAGPIESVKTIGEDTVNPKPFKGCGEPGCGDTHKHSVDEDLTVEIDSPKPDKPIPEKLKSKKSKSV